MCEFVRRVSVFRLPMEHQCTATYANARGKRLRVELGGYRKELGARAERGMKCEIETEEHQLHGYQV